MEKVTLFRTEHIIRTLHDLLMCWFPPPLRSGGNARVEQLTPDSPSAPLRGEPGVRDRCPSGTAQLAHSASGPLSICSNGF